MTAHPVLCLSCPPQEILRELTLGCPAGHERGQGEGDAPALWGQRRVGRLQWLTCLRKVTRLGRLGQSRQPPRPPAGPDAAFQAWPGSCGTRAFAGVDEGAGWGRVTRISGLAWNGWSPRSESA